VILEACLTKILAFDFGDGSNNLPFWIEIESGFAFQPHKDTHQKQKWVTSTVFCFTTTPHAIIHS